MIKGISFLHIIWFSFFVFQNQTSHAQCCSPGNPVGGTFALGIVEKGNVKFFLNHKYGYSGLYYYGNKPTSSGFIKNGNYNFTGINTFFGISKRLTGNFETGYFQNKTQNYVEGILPEKQVGTGFSDINIGLNFNFYKNRKREIEVTSGVGLKFPIGSYNKTYNGGIVPYDLQPTSGAQDVIYNLFLYKGFLPQHIRLFLLGRIEFKGKNREEYQFGNLYSGSFFISYSLSTHWIIISQFRAEIRERDTRPLTGVGIIQKNNREAIIVTGSQKIFIIPQVSYIFNKDWMFSVLVDVPLYQYYNNKQLANSYAVSLSLSKEFKGKNKIKADVL